MLSFDSPLSLHTSSLSNWIDGTGSISREESEFLSREEDLLTIAPLDDGVHSWLERFVSTCLSWVSSACRKLERIQITVRLSDGIGL
jgi:hypothetical protein